MVVLFLGNMGKGDRKRFGGEIKHCTLVRLVEIPLDIQVEATGRPGYTEFRGQS